MAQFWASVLGAVVGSGVVATLVAARADKTAASRLRRETLADAARDVLKKLDLYYQLNASTIAFDPVEMKHLEADVDAETDKCGDPALRVRVRMFKTVGRSRVSGDPDVNEEAYLAELAGVRDRLHAYVRG